MNQRSLHALAALLCLGAMASTTAAKSYKWKFSCQGDYHQLFSRSWCENDWDAVGNWTVIPSGGYPDDGADSATIETDTYGSTNGDWLQINLVTVSISTLTIQPYDPGLDGPGGVYKIRLAVWGDETVTTTHFKIDASDGDVTLMAGGGAKIQTG